jgi:hypothetical protein
VRKKFGRHEGAFTVPSTSKVTEWHASDSLSLAKTLGVLSFTPLTMVQACAQAVDFKVGHHFGEGQVRNMPRMKNKCLHG